MCKDNGGPAFPAPEAARARFGAGNEDMFSGVTVRDYFAGKALQGFCADPTTAGTRKEHLISECYELADMMLSERAK